MIDAYKTFLIGKTQYSGEDGFKPLFIPDCMMDFQKELLDWNVRKGRSATFADCGLGKTLLELAWCQNVAMQTNKPVLLLVPLAVAPQTVREGVKFGIECIISRDGKFQDTAKIVVTNYEKLHLFDWKDFSGCCCDESSILKNFDGERKTEVTIFMRKLPYRLLGTATAAPNDWPELGTSSEALGYLGYMDMLGKFFKNNQSTSKPMSFRNKGRNHEQARDGAKWRLKGHAELPFWKWVCGWAKAVRRPSDMGYEDGKFILPPLIENLHIVNTTQKAEGYLITLPAVGLKEQRQERRLSINERCATMAELTSHKEQVLVSCHLNPEGDLLEKMIDGAVQISGSDCDELKEERLEAFISGQARVLVSKDQIIGFGLNLQHCHRLATFPSHSLERHYQFKRRCWRFGQTQPVVMDMVASEGELNVLKNLQRKERNMSVMFDRLIAQMHNAEKLDVIDGMKQKEKIPSWLKIK